jgi:hypothetical protein
MSELALPLMAVVDRHEGVRPAQPRNFDAQGGLVGR